MKRMTSKMSMARGLDSFMVGQRILDEPNLCVWSTKNCANRRSVTATELFARLLVGSFLSTRQPIEILYPVISVCQCVLLDWAKDLQHWWDRHWSDGAPVKILLRQKAGTGQSNKYCSRFEFKMRQPLNKPRAERRLLNASQSFFLVSTGMVYPLNGC